MTHDYLNGTAWIAITPPYVERLEALGADAIERLRAFGLDDRRESAWSLVLAGAVPFVGMIVLGWSPAEVVMCLLLNLLILLIDDLWKILRARGSIGELVRDCEHDAFVWPLARALSNGRRTVYGKSLPTLEDLDQGRATIAPFMLAFVAICAVAMPAYLVRMDQALVVAPTTLVLGTLPSVMLFLVASVVHARKHHAHWREAGSVRMATTQANSMVTAGVGGAALVMFVIVAPDPIASPDSFAGMSCVVVALLGMYRFGRCGSLPRTARWLERWLQAAEARAERERAAAELATRAAG